MSEWAIRTKFDFTSLVFRLIEHGDIPLDILIEDGQETNAIQGISKDPTVNILTDTDVLSATEIQRRIAEHAMTFAQHHPSIPKHELAAAMAVLQACDDIEEYFYGDKSLERISDRIDWAAKLQKLHTRRIKLGDASCKNLIAVFHDLKWEDIDPIASSARWYRAHQPSHHTEGDMLRASKVAPRGLAARRTELLVRHQSDIVLANWNIIQRRNELPLKVSDESKPTSQL